MKIEEEIKQKKFETEFQKATLNIIFTAGWLNSHTNQVLKPFGISQEQYNVLRILRGQHPNACTLGTITERMVSKMSNATRLVDKLKNNGFVSREVCPTNRRKVDIAITHKGLELLRTIDPLIDKKFVEIQNVSDEDLAILNGILDRIREAES